MVEVKRDPSGSFITLLDQNGTSIRFHAVWLRDNALEPSTISPTNGQRLITIDQIPADLSITNAVIQDSALIVDFSTGPSPVTYPLAWLYDNAYDKALPTQRGWTAEDIKTWDSQLNTRVPSADFGQLQSDPAARCSWLGDIIKYGFAKLTGGPVESGALFQVVDLFGYVRDTNYGRHFEVRTEVSPTNLAYTGQGLQAHTDNPYRDPCPTVQVLYCLESSAAGGENMVVDGFAAAQRLREENEAHFNILADHCAVFEYAGDQKTHLTARRPMIELTPDGEIVAVQFNNRSLSAVRDVPFDQMQLWYDAYRHLASIIDDETMEVRFRLEPGDAFIVDNRRVLHARKAYSGTGTRWLQGCYADMDSLSSTYRVLEKTS